MEYSFHASPPSSPVENRTLPLVQPPKVELAGPKPKSWARIITSPLLAEGAEAVAAETLVCPAVILCKLTPPHRRKAVLDLAVGLRQCKNLCTLNVNEDAEKKDSPPTHQFCSSAYSLTHSVSKRNDSFIDFSTKRTVKRFGESPVTVEGREGMSIPPPHLS